MTAFDTAWAIAKADTGMWDEIYAPLYDVFGGRGRNPYEYAIPLDFMQTKDLPPERHFQGQEPKNDEYIEELMESIMEHGMLGRTAPFWVFSGESPEEGQARFDRSKAGEGHPGNVSIPKIGYSKYSDEGWNINEGNHRTAALRRLGAPTIPVYASSSGWGRTKPYSADLPLGENMRRWMGLDENQDELDDYGITASLGRRSMPVPPSFMFGRELVPNMGRLIPDLPKGLSIEGMPLNETRMREGWWGEANDPTGGYGDWQNRPKWKVIYD
jgi:hypothetical protein